MNSGLIQQIGRETAAPFIEQWHYLHTVPTGKNIFFGRYDDDQTLYAVANYGIGVNNYQAAYLGRHTGYDVTPDTLLELKRMCRREPKQETMPLTRFLKICHHALKKQGVRFIIAFSDPEQGHNGGIYKAANFTYLGKTNSERHLIDTDGTLVHRRRVLRYMERHTLNAASARRQLGLTIIKTMSKERWFLALNREARRAKEQMPSRTSLGQDRDRRLERDLQVMVFASGTPSPASGGHVEALAWYGAAYALMRPLYPFWKMLFPNCVTTTECVGRATLNVTKRGSRTLSLRIAISTGRVTCGLAAATFR